MEWQWQDQGPWPRRTPGLSQHPAHGSQHDAEGDVASVALHAVDGVSGAPGRAQARILGASDTESACGRCRVRVSGSLSSFAARKATLHLTAFDFLRSPKMQPPFHVNCSHTFEEQVGHRAALHGGVRNAEPSRSPRSLCTPRPPPAVCVLTPLPHGQPGQAGASWAMTGSESPHL